MGPPNGKGRAIDQPQGSVNGKQARKSDGAVSRHGADQDGDEGMGEFEDAFEDEFEQEDEAEGSISGSRHGSMDIDGVRFDEEIQRPESDDEEQEPETKVYIPGVGEPLQKGQQLEPDQSAYEMLHRLNVTWPCLSFDILQDHLGSINRRYPQVAYFVAGTQADTAKNNELMVMKASSMHKTNKDGGEYCERAHDFE
jgi:ribosome assembly protein RRB1